MLVLAGFNVVMALAMIIWGISKICQNKSKENVDQQSKPLLDSPSNTFDTRRPSGSILKSNRSHSYSPAGASTVGTDTKLGWAVSSDEPVIIENISDAASLPKSAKKTRFQESKYL